MRLSNWLPILDWGRRYDRVTFARDGLAAAIVTIMLIPQSLAYAMLAGLPPVVGLYASILPLVAYALLGTSATLAVGPVAVVSLMTATAVGAIAEPGTAAYLGAAVVLAFLSGLILLVMGVARLGALANLLSHPVILGFITASAILIALSQMRHILGVDGGGHDVVETVGKLIASLPNTDFATLVIGVGSIVFLSWSRKGLAPALGTLGLNAGAAAMLARTGPVMVVIVSILALTVLNLEVAVVGDIPRGLPGLVLPGFDAELWFVLLPAAALISLIGFVESVSVAQTLAAKRRQSIRPDQELVGLGAANIASALSGGYPVTGGFARSVVNFDAGARTPAAGAFTALGIAGAALFLTPLLYNLPIAVLAATIIVAVLSLIDVTAIRRIVAYSRGDALALAVTIVAVLGFGVEAGMLSGVAASITLHLARTTRPHVAVIGQVPGTEHYRNVTRHAVECPDQVLGLRIDESLYFANARGIETLIAREAAARPHLAHVVLNCAAVNGIDASALESLELIMHRLEAAGIGLHLSEVKGPVMDRLEGTDFLKHLTGQVFLSHHQAVCALRGAPAKTG